MNSAERVQRLALGWADYRRRQWAAGLLFVGFLPLMTLIGVVIEDVTQSDGFIVVPAAGLMFATLCAGWRFILFRCPNCQHRFHLTSIGRLTNGRKCPHCGLERYQPD